MRLQVRLTVYFEDPFWVGVFERRQEGRLTAARVVFGAEPKDYTVYEHFLRGWRSLRFSPPVAAGEEGVRAGNPKRAQREAARQLARSGSGTKAQQALALLHEESVRQRKENGKRRREEDRQRQYELRKERKKEKHRGH